ncbi:MAG: nucleotidyl transferase AbiEii/AbiGii toxin family protein [Chthoniobacterales bacterium]
MKVSGFEAIVGALNDAGVRFIVVGGLAVIAHGYLRVTHDVDVVIKLTPGDIANAFRALASIGYLPSVPVTIEQFSDPAQREEWRTQRNMVVLKMWSERHPETPLDIFIHEPFDFDEEYRRAYRPEDPALAAAFVSLPALIAMKESSGREHDRIDVEKLRQIADWKES